MRDKPGDDAYTRPCLSQVDSAIDGLVGERHIDCDHVDRLTTRDLGGFEKGGGERGTWIKYLWWIIKKSRFPTPFQVPDGICLVTASLKTRRYSP